MKSNAKDIMPAGGLGREGIYRLQGFFRFVLAMMVLWSHSVVVFFPAARSWFPHFQLGNVAVSAFFVLSGYLMAEAVTLWYADRLRHFIVNRYLRISPPLFVAAAVSIAIHFSLQGAGITLVGLEDVPEGAISLRNAVSALLEPAFPLNIPLGKLFNTAAQSPPYAFVRYSWAIFTEMIFYWLLAFFLAAASVAGVRAAVVTFSIGILALFAVSTASYNELLGHGPLAGLVARVPFVSSFQWAPHFAVGVLVARCARQDWRGAVPVAGLTASVLLAFIQLGFYASHGLGGAAPVLILYALVLAAGFLVILSRRQEISVGPVRLTSAADQSFGNLSYPIYINQFSLSVALLSILFHLAGAPVGSLSAVPRTVAFVVFNVLIIAAAAALIFLTDALTDHLRDRIRGAVISVRAGRSEDAGPPMRSDASKQAPP